MDVIIITGQSGAGKSTTISALEDRGVYCVDNVPASLIPAFVKLTNQSTAIETLALVTDARAGEMFNGLVDSLKALREAGIGHKVLFLQCSDDVLERRYRETRRRHPLQKDRRFSISDAISREKEMLKNAYALADYHIDTTFLKVAQLKEQVNSLFEDIKEESMSIKLMSFGFKYGSPSEADLLFDARCIPNPFYVPELKELSGKDAPIVEWLGAFEETTEFLKRICDYLDFTIPLYKKEGKSQLVIGIGCTGGRHRSVAVTEAVDRHLKAQGYNCAVIHRDMEKVRA